MSKLSKGCHLRILATDGFTLIELMIGMVISGILVSAIYAAYSAQQKSYIVQEQVAEMQQNLRAGMMLIVQDVRMAGYDPTSLAGARITSIDVGQMSFSQDLNDDGDVADFNEVIDFGFSVIDDATRDGLPDSDADGNGVPDPVSLGIQTGGAGGYQPVAYNIQAVEFNYLDSTGAVTADPADIRAVQISLLARAARTDRNFTNTMTYTPASGTPWDLNGAAAGNAANDNFRRRLLIATVNCRNMGM